MSVHVRNQEVYQKNKGVLSVKPILSFRDFSFRYENQANPTIKNINLDIYPNEKVLILGPSGSGKSTLGRCMNGLIPNVFEGEISGEATIFGKEISAQSITSLSEEVGTVLQDTSAQFVGLTVAEDVAFLLENDGVQNHKMHQKVQEWSERMDLAELLGLSPQDLSGGQKQRVSVSGVLIGEPDVLLFDEPLANLDPASGEKTIALIDSIQKELQATIIIIEHRLEDVLTQSVDRVVILEKGEMVFNDTPEILLKSNVLNEVGIRTPLYLSAMQYADVDIQNLNHIDNLYQVDGMDVKEKVQDWHQMHMIEEHEETGDELLKLEKVNFAYDRKRQILKDIHLMINKGEMISIVGTNGAGKTTLANIVSAFLTPNTGKVYWEGLDVTKDTIAQRAGRVGYVLQDPNQMISQHMIFDEVALGLRNRENDEAAIQEKVHQALKICGLYPFREWPINALSYGQKKRVTIAAILVLEPEILILDEPTAGQDYRHYSEFMTFIRGLNEAGMTILMITHDMQLMLEYSNRTIVVNEGQIIADVSPFDVLTSKTLTKEASLRLTSLYTLAKRMGIEDTNSFTRNFIHYERTMLRE